VSVMAYWTALIFAAGTTTTTPSVTVPRVPLPHPGPVIHVLLQMWPFLLLLAIAGLGRLAFDLMRHRRLARAGLPEIDQMDGQTFERRLAVLFGDAGFSVEHTGNVGGDYGCDLLITRDGRRRVVQAKRSRKNIGVKAVQEAATARMHYGADDAMVVTNSRFTTPAKKLAASNRVELWDRDRLVTELLRSPSGEPVAEPISKPPLASCASCGKAVSDKVANFCSSHPERFRGLVYCYEHQRSV
jgi:restriction system protein